MFKFIFRQPFWVNLVAAILLIASLGFLFLKSLSWFTNHGTYLKVPSVLGKNVDEAVKSLESQGFDVTITDSIYDDNVPLNTVKKQLPDSGAEVKVNRTVFLNVNPVVLPMVDMPKLEGLSLRFALERLSKGHLKMGDTTYRPDFMKGTILEQNYRGSKVLPGAKLRWGIPIDLVIGGGLAQRVIAVPQLFGLTLAEAKAQLDAKGITLAALVPSGNITDTTKAFVYKQNPEATNNDGQPTTIQPGQTMDLWISAEPPAQDTTELMTPKTDSIKK